MKTSRKSWGIDALGTVVAEVELASGHVGVGVSIGGAPACFIIENHLARFVEGQDVRNTELMWDQMWRGTINYGRKGLPIQAISAVDLAIWDALGKALGQPVYQLLGGKTKERLPIYCTSTRPELSKELGFFGGKIPLPYGPADGDVGMRKNIERIKVCGGVGVCGVGGWGGGGYLAAQRPTERANAFYFPLTTHTLPSPNPSPSLRPCAPPAAPTSPS